MSESVTVDDRGMFVPSQFRQFNKQIVFRTPRSTIQHFSSDPLDPFYPMIESSDFGDVEEFRDPRNPDLAPDRVRIKPRGEEAVEMTVEIRGGDEA